MAQNGTSDSFSTPISRFYVDIRPYAPLSSTNKRVPAEPHHANELPLLDTLPQADQDKIVKFIRKPDRFMSLASALLKRYFIHRTARISWSEVQVSRTPKPHMRPYWVPPSEWTGRGFEGLEFNVSHQAGVVVLMGCKTPSRPRDARIDDQDEISIRSPAVINPDPMAVLETESEIDEDEPEDVRIGVDIACTWEPPRTQDLSTQAKLNEWVDIFGEMFSKREQEQMKHEVIEHDGTHGELGQKARRFYTYWALKEAYIKMVGEGLLAPWLRQLEFMNVKPPRRPRGGDRWAKDDEAVNTGFKALFADRNISSSMKTELEAFEETFIVASMTRGVTESDVSNPRWTKLDFGQIEQCAKGICSC